MTPTEKENITTPVTATSTVNPKSPDIPSSPNISSITQVTQPIKPEPSIKPDLISTLEEKDRKNQEEALNKVIDEAKKLIRDFVIPPVENQPI